MAELRLLKCSVSIKEASKIPPPTYFWSLPYKFIVPQNPLPKRPWRPQTIYANGTYSKWCPQPPFYDPGTQDEDCLYLNIFTPRFASSYSPGLAPQYPVMVWIHGGALEMGSAGEYVEAGILKNLVRRGVIVASINYRLGALGKRCC